MSQAACAAGLDRYDYVNKRDLPNTRASNLPNTRAYNGLRYRHSRNPPKDEDGKRRFLASSGKSGDHPPARDQHLCAVFILSG